MKGYSYSDAVTQALETGDISQLKEFGKEMDRRMAEMQRHLPPQLATKTNAVGVYATKKKVLRGLGRVYLRGSVWWVSYYHRGKQYRESSHGESEPVARKLLKRRLVEVNSGRLIPHEDRLTFEDMVQDLENDYRINGRRSLASALFYIQHLRGFFGFDRAIDITPDRVRAYQTLRLEEGAANATANREVATLGRMLSLAVGAGRLSRKPRFQMLEENNVRQGFLEHGDFLVLLSNLPEYLKPIAEFLYLSGWRKGEARKLEWRDVDSASRVVRLRIENSKNKESRLLPLTGRLWEIIQESARERRLDCPYVFHRGGRRIGDFRKAWATARKASGLEGVIPHDLRRCAARNLSRAGVAESVAMEITGHKTRSMYRRYWSISLKGPTLFQRRGPLKSAERSDEAIFNCLP